MQHECIQPENTEKNSRNDATVRPIGEQSARDRGGRLCKGGCKDRISVESQLVL